jgi:hypothetical protein
VAVLAFDAERGSDELHGGKYLIGWHAFQNLDVLELLFRELGSGRLRCGARLGFRGSDDEYSA